ncbi:30S ribosomal protein S4 [bacterium]|nr:30S ribosomal protein S4 [bacterium]MBU1782573.1 30S ribosomal protein S4 [bacterium]MBU2600241.1 30S ribosomal protein S4 [bacterium]
MARYIGPVCKLCRREGVKLFLKGERCDTSKCALVRKKSEMGAKPKGAKKKLSNYAVQLREKQKLKRIYGILEKQFKNYFVKAKKQRGIVGDNLLTLLERRLDNVICRLNWVVSHRQARQLVKHGFLLVNGRRVDVPSFLVKSGDEIRLKEDKNIKELVETSLKSKGQKDIPSWLLLDTQKILAKILKIPTREDVIIPIKEQLVVELCSR